MDAAPIRFSVITPTHRRPQSLLRMLDGLSGQTYPADLFEAVVIIDGEDETREALRDRRFPFRLRVVSQDKGGPAVARNRGLQHAAEPYALFLDDDVIPRPALVENHAAAHDQPGIVSIGPLLPVALSRPSPWTQWEWQTLSAQYRAMREGRWSVTPRQFYTGNASVRIADVAAVGGFRPEFTRGEDVELAWRLHDRGLRFVFIEAAGAEHLAQRSFEAWLKAAHDYGRTDVMFERLRSGGDLPGWVAREFKGRHRYTRALAKSVVARPATWRTVPGLGGMAARIAATARLHGVAMKVCSALFTAAYWRGVAEQLGRERTLALLRPDGEHVTQETPA